MKNFVDDALVIEMQKPVILDKILNHDLNPLRTLDPPVLWKILNAFLFPEGTVFDRALNEDKHCCSVLLQWGITNILEHFDLRYGDIKLLQAATGMLISGSVITSLLHNPFTPNDLDFFCGGGLAHEIVEYLKVVGNFTLTTQSEFGYEDVFGVRSVIYLWNPAGRKINIIESYSDYPFDVVLNFHSAPPKGVIAYDRISHFEVNRLRQGLALITPSTLHLDAGDLSSHIRCWAVLHKYIARGFRFVFEYDQPHVCGEHIDCPATIRNTRDDGCLHVYLPFVPIPHFTPPPMPVIAGSLTGSKCNAGRLADGRHARSAMQYQNLVFRKFVQAFIRMPQPPVNVIEIYPWGDEYDEEADSDWSGESD
ncbi:hypothetical protein B0H19DRAFT_1270785 [Mycena capillaripes]|nr:hypothetical protein B0H19DRAFT_1270785 [Mycena capillaripes]